MRHDGSWEGETFLRHFGTGESIPVSANSFLVTRASDGTPLALATVQRDLRARLRQEREALVRAQEQRAVAELGRLALTVPLLDLMDEAVRLIHARYPSLVAGVLRRSPDGLRSEMVASSLTDWDPVVLDLDDDSLTGRALVRNQLVVTEDVVADPSFPHDGATAQYGMRSAICCPIPGGERPWGIVGASGVDPRRWSVDDIAFVESVAATLGAAVRRQDLEVQLQHQALHDPLTGLPNRALVLDRIDHALDRSARRNAMLGVILLDLDDFKTVNDSLGHSTGDALLTELATRFERVSRPGDTVARLGGDEFVVVCEDVRSEEDVTFVVESLLEACAAPVQLGGHRLSLSASAGVALAVSGDGNHHRAASARRTSRCTAPSGTAPGPTGSSTRRCAATCSAGSTWPASCARRCAPTASASTTSRSWTCAPGRWSRWRHWRAGPTRPASGCRPTCSSRSPRRPASSASSAARSCAAPPGRRPAGSTSARSASG